MAVRRILKVPQHYLRIGHEQDKGVYQYEQGIAQVTIYF
jgi:hypothetical protein